MARNPIALVRQGAKRERIPDVLDADELKKLLSELQQPYKTMVFLAATTGLRVSELLALTWQDIKVAAGETTLRRAIVQQVVGEMKTESSQKPVPMEGTLAEAFPGLESTVAVSPPATHFRAGKNPVHQATVLARELTTSAHPACCIACRHHEGGGLALLPQNVCNTAAGEWGGREDYAGTDASRQQQDYAGRLRSGSDASETGRSAEGS